MENTVNAITGENNNQGIPNSAPQKPMGFAVHTLRHIAWVGPLAGVGLGLAGRFFRDVPFSFSSRKVCRAGPSHPVAAVVNRYMQWATKGLAKYALPLTPLLFLVGKAAVNALKKEDRKSSSVWASFKEEIAKIRKQEVIHATTLVALAVLSAVTQSLWVDFAASSPDPSGHVMMMTVLGAAASQGASAIHKMGHRTTAKVFAAFSAVMGVSSVFFLHHTVSACHTVPEVYDGLKWTLAVVLTTALPIYSHSYFSSR